MAALQPGQALVDLEQAVVGIAGASSRADVRHVVADAHLGEAGDRLRPADAQLVVQRTEAAQVERRVVERVVVVADQQVVDDAGPDDAVPVGAHAPERVLAEAAVEQRHGGLFGARLVRLLGVAHVDLVGVRGVPVDLDVELVGLFPGSALAQIVVAEVAQWTADVGARIEGLVGQQVARELAEAAHRNLVVRERLAGLRIVDDDRRARREQAAQIAVAPGVGNHRRERIGRRRLLPSTLVVGEEEQLVLHDRPANGAAEDLAVEVRFAAAGPVGRPRRRRQLVVAPVVEAVAADAVGSRLDDHVDDRPGDVAELGRVVVGLDADLLHRVRARLVGDQVVDGVVHVDAVEHEVVGLFALAVDVGPAAAGVLQAVERARIGRGDAGGEERGGRQVAALHRQLLDLIALQRLPDDRVLGLQHRAGGDDLDLFLDAADLELEVDAGGLRGRQLHGRLDALEAGQLDLHDIAGDRHAGDDIGAGVVGDAGVVDVGRLIGCRDGDAGDGAAAVVGDDAGQRGQAGLGRDGRRRDEPEAQAHD